MKKLVLVLLVMWAFIDYSSYKSLTYGDSFFGKWDSATYYKNQPYIAHLNAKLQNIIAYGYFALPFSGRCSNKIRTLESEGQSVADYFQCDKFQRLINQE